jgi:RNA-directed DNA polymerase
LIRQKFKTNVTRQEDFIHVSGNLYLVLTPLAAGAPTMIEDFFTAHTLGIEIGGKKFDPDKDADTQTHFGKQKFAEYIEGNFTKIDFGGFSAILSRLEAVIVAHTALPGAVAQGA